MFSKRGPGFSETDLQNDNQHRILNTGLPLNERTRFLILLEEWPPPERLAQILNQWLGFRDYCEETRIQSEFCLTAEELHSDPLERLIREERLINARRTWNAAYNSLESDDENDGDEAPI